MILGLAIVAGFCVGLVIGGVGGGGALLTVPVLVYLLDVPPEAAVTVSLLVATPTAAVGVVGHWRAGNVDLRSGSTFAAFGASGSYLGTRLGQTLDPDVLVMGFGTLMVTMGGLLISRDTRSTGVDQPIRPSSPHARTPHRLILPVAAVAVGVLTGMFGIGGGVLIAPALAALMRMRPRTAIGTSLVVVTLNGIMALAARGGSLWIPGWAVTGTFGVGGMAGAVVGVAVANRLGEDRLTKPFAGAVIVLGLAIIASYVLNPA